MTHQLIKKQNFNKLTFFRRGSGSLIGKMRRVGATIKGFGDYKIANNSIMKGGMTPPMITNSISNGAVIIRHREYLRDIFNSVDFQNISFDLNPGITSSFPWLSQIAMSFAQYRFRGLVFEFKSTSSDTVLSTAASTSLGTVVMATQYNALDDPFTNKFEMENWEYSVSTKPSLSCMCPIECAKSQTPVSLLWTRNGPKPGDERLYDLGNFNIATVGMQGAVGSSAIGELWCSYEIEFFKPQFIEDVSTTTAYFDLLQPIQNNPYSPKFTSIGSALPFGTGNDDILPWMDKPGNSNVSNISINPSQRSLKIKDSIAKRLFITFGWRYANAITSLTPPAILAIVGAKKVYFIGQNFGSLQTPSPGSGMNAGDWCIIQTVIEVTSDNASINFTTGATIPTGQTATFFYCYITELAPDVAGIAYDP